jgi:DNA-binding response OmpR family regulator
MSDGEHGVASPTAPLDLLPPSLRIAAIDRDSEFLRALARRAELADWILLARLEPVGVEVLLGGGSHALLVNIGLLGPHWEDWLARQAARFPEIAMLALSERSTMRQRIRGLRAGADDWITKPCHADEVIARLWAAMRARRLHLPNEELMRLRSAELQLRPELFDAFVNERPAHLTRREFDVLMTLARYRGQVVERSRLYREVWGFEMIHGDRSVDTFVRKIRSKLIDVSPRWRYIHTHKGVGYRFAGEPLRRTRRP